MRVIQALMVMLTFCPVFFSGNRGHAEEPPQMLFFYREICDECRLVRSEFLPGFLERWGDRIQFVSIEVSRPEYLDSLYAMESRAQLPEAGKHYPAIYFMGIMTEGPESIALNLDELVTRYFANPDSAQAVNREVLARVPEKYDEKAAELAKTVHVAYFYESSCAECTRAFEITQWIENLYGSVQIEKFDMALEKNRRIARALGSRAGIPEKSLVTPIVFIGTDYMLSDQITRTNFIQLINTYKETGAEAVWASLTEEELNRFSPRSESAIPFKPIIPAILLLAGCLLLWAVFRRSSRIKKARPQ